MSKVWWLGHNDDNKVTVLYSGEHDTEKGQRRELVKIIRSGRLVRRIRDEDGARKAWGATVSEAEMNRIAFPLSYDPDELNAVQIADHLVNEALVT